jgi:putative tricarboxylic transport membrane protein
VKVSDLVVGLASVVLGLALLGYGAALPPMPGQRYGAGLFPILLGGCFALCGALVARKGWLERRAARVPLVALDDWARDRTLVGNLAVVLGLILVYVLFSERIGFIPLSIAILVALFLRLKVRPLLSVAVAVAATAFIYVAFARFLRVPLPRGLLEGIVW